MENAAKRRRVDEPASPIGDIDFNEARKANDIRLKSRFEAIFEKYGKNFGNASDEIDLVTGKVVINNGHLSLMDNELDVGRGLWDDFHPDDDDDDDNEEDANEDSSKIQANDAGDTIENGSIVISQDPPPLFNFEGNSHEETPPVLSPHCTDPFKERDSNLLGDNNSLEDPIWQVPDIGPMPTDVPSSPLRPQDNHQTPPSPNSSSLWTYSGQRRKRKFIVQKPRTPDRPSAKSPTEAPSKENNSDSDDPLQSWTKMTPRKMLSCPSELVTPPAQVDVIIPSTPSILGPPLIEEEHLNAPETPGFDVPNTMKDSQISPNNFLCEYPNVESSSSVHLDNVLKELLEVENIFDDASATPNPNINFTTDESQNISETPPKSARSLTPEEVKSLITLRLVKKRPWREVSLAIPAHSPAKIRQWYYKNYTKNCSTPTRPWTTSEQRKMEIFEARPPDTWEELQSAFGNNNAEQVQLDWVNFCARKSSSQRTDFSSGEHAKHSLEELDLKTLPVPIDEPTIRAQCPSELDSSERENSLPGKEADTASNTGSGGGSERSESPDPLNAAFDNAWLLSGLSAVQINTPPKARSKTKQIPSTSTSQSRRGASQRK
ncbi:hypothetical protein FQN57_005454 [Myotisia sp. PD_48]|nr:hypothetical protein FQN57_005454 [Myotisia sp. PD_48]